MSLRTKEWSGRITVGACITGLLVLAGCYARTGPGAYYYEAAPPQPVYYAPAQAQVQVQTQGTYYEQPAQQVYYEQPAQQVYYEQPAQPTVYVQPAQPTVYVQQPAQPTVYVQPAQPASVQYYDHRGHGRRQHPVNFQQGGEPVRVEVRGSEHGRGVVNVR